MRAILAPILAAVVAATLATPAPAQQASLGGGFIELLLTGRDPTPATREASVRYAAPPPAAAAPPPAARLAPPEREPAARARPAPQPQPRVAALPPASGPVSEAFRRQVVRYDGPHPPGTIVVDTGRRFLFLVQEGGTAIRYGVGVGREGFSWRGSERITRMAKWPDWRPPAAMRRRQPDLPAFMAGGPGNPLGARALYLGNTLYRIHGTNEPHTIGRAMSSGCIRMMNDDVIHLYERVRVGTRVVVL